MRDREFYMRVWEQEYVNMRHQSDLRWSRLRWFFLLETGIIYSVYILDKSCFLIFKFVSMPVAFFMMIILSMLFIKDGKDFEGHKRRMEYYRKLLLIEPFPSHELGRMWKLSGQKLVQLGLLVINIANLIILFDVASNFYHNKIYSALHAMIVLIITIILLLTLYVIIVRSEGHDDSGS